MRSTFFGKGTLVAIATFMALGVAASSVAQTQGMQRRDARRDTRHTARATKHACKAGDENTLAECRQAKRHVKQNARRGGGQPAPAEAPATQ